MAASLPAKALLLFVVVVFSACVGGDAAEVAATDVAPEGVGGIRGILVSEELFPVAGAFVEIVAGASTVSDETGRFLFEGLAPGPTLLNISADGYEPKQQEVTVPEEGFAEVRVAMVGIPGKSPYVLSLIFRGFTRCSFSAVYSAGTFEPCPSGEASNRTFKTEVGPDWRAGVHEMDWPSNEEMTFASTLDGGFCRGAPPPPSKCAALLTGRAPLRVFARPDDAEYASKHAVDGKVTWPTGNYTSWLTTFYSGYFRTEINGTFNPACQEINAAGGAPRSLGCPFGVGVTFGIRFTFYHTTFYFQSPDNLEDFSMIPDK